MVRAELHLSSQPVISSFASKYALDPSAGYLFDEKEEDYIEFCLQDVLDFNGFCEGEILNTVFSQWLDMRGVSSLEYRYYNEHYLLWCVWKRFLEPKSGFLPDEVVFYGSSYNPVRIAEGFSQSGFGEIDTVKVKIAEIFVLADEVFADVTPLWLEVFNSMYGAAPSRPDYTREMSVVYADRVCRAILEFGSGGEELYLSLLQGCSPEQGLFFESSVAFLGALA